ncbi:MAG: hypothetical protein KF764_28495 [Labilithrix sp.]|nr:hypothetical protein [Labilithrix sp.]MBX3223990.1 hypothetical protein [Labilithrix sp.]
MPTAHRLLLVIVASLGLAPVAACTLASPTTINVQQGEESPDAATTTTTTSASGGAAAACGTDDFITPDLTKLTPCGDGKGHCFDKSRSPIAEELTACANADEVCVPDEILLAGGKPLATCTSVIGPGGCVTASLLPTAMERGKGVLKPDVCEPHQLCLPCNDPTNGNAATPFCQPIGVHENACAAPAAGDGGAAQPGNPPCCTTNGVSNGVCLAASAIPEAQRDKAKQDTCARTDKCVPAAFVANKPVKCSGGVLGEGVCMDRCFSGMMSLAGSVGVLKTEGCGETEVCVPCRFTKGQNVPGCEE